MSESDAAGGEFNVVQFFQDGSYEYVRRRVSPKEAMSTFRTYTQNPASLIGITRRVIVTDSGDETNAEWTFEDGYTFPPELVQVALQQGLKAKARAS